MQIYRMPWMTYFTTDTSEVFVPATEWVLIDPKYVGARGWFEFRAEEGSAHVSVGVQTATDVATPDAHVKVAALQSTEGLHGPDSTAATVSLLGKKYLRGGYVVKSNAGALAGGALNGVVEMVE